MSFSLDVKREICQTEPENPCCAAAACYGLACFARQFDRHGMKLVTEKAFIAQWAKKVFAGAGIEGKVYKRGETAGYAFTLDNAFETEKLFALLGHSGDETSLHIREDNFLCEGCFRAFAAAAFLAGGTVVNPEKGYGLEFVSPRHGMVADFASLLAKHGFDARRTVRGGYNVLYFRASEQIEDMLTLMGAPGQALEIMSLKVYKDHRNRANRITNCETANIDKTVAASAGILRAIAVLEQHGALEALPEPLVKAALLRKEYPDLSLAELAELFDEPVSKSGLSHRYAKIKEKAKEFTRE